MINKEFVASPAIEWAPFTLAAGATEADLLQAAERLQTEFLSRQPGFLRRELLRDERGEWVDLLLWRDAAAHATAMEAAGEHPAARAFFAVLVLAEAPAPGGLRLFTCVKRWDAAGT